MTAVYPIIHAAQRPVDTRRGGQTRILLGPQTANAQTGFLGVVELTEGESVAEHIHDFSDEFFYVVTGSVEVDLDDVVHAVPAAAALLVPRGVRHRMRNPSTTPAQVVFCVAPLAPHPSQGHRDLETASR